MPLSQVPLLPTGFPVMCPEDVFFLDPLLPPGQRVPLYLSEVPPQVKVTAFHYPQACGGRAPGRQHFSSLLRP